MEEVISNPNAFKEFYTQYEVHSQHVLYPKRVKFRNLDVVVTKESAYLKNSLHKYYNLKYDGSDHNSNDFTFSMLCEVVEEILSKSDEFGFGVITQLEIGFNIDTKLPAEEIIRSAIFLYKEKAYTANENFNGNGELLLFKSTNYLIKIYDKAKQYSIAANKLRFELKYTERAELKKLRINHLSDLVDKKKIRLLCKNLLIKLDDFLIIDAFDSVGTIPEKDKDSLRKYSSDRFWRSFGQKRGLVGLSRQAKGNHKKRLKVLVDKHELSKTKTLIKDGVIKKYVYLMNN
ncbi:hypothetical protein [Flavobacterium enshiense]|uniref:hypothetical protein n=1 Tax=Flavobacterium enshiense TaxID=1341165 RepID=UPI00138ABAE4|nr:hypothetical protein [Flavobacterium enshiense]